MFLGGGQRRMVCELSKPRATHEGWRREVEEQFATSLPPRPQRSRSLLGRLRQFREPAPASGLAREASAQPQHDELQAGGATTGPAEWSVEPEWSGIDAEWAGMGAEGASGQPAAEEALALDRAAAEHALPPAPDSPEAFPASAAADVRRALEVFNAGEPPRRVAGVSRSLGAASVRAAPVAQARSRVSIVVAWELCWYRYEIDLGDEAAGARIVAEGMELEELSPEERLANATANEHGELSLLGD